MAVTGEKVFELALILMDEVDDNGSINTGDTASYRGKTPSILTILQTEVLPNTVTPTVITDLTQDLSVSDKVALQVLPYGLAAHLMLTEDQAVASYFSQRYEELRSKIPATITPIVDKYNLLGDV